MRADKLSLPPTPSDLERIELIERSLSLIQRSTHDVMSAVSAHAFEGFSENTEHELTQHIADTRLICRRCEHCLSQCNTRTIASAVRGSSATLIANAAQIISDFEQVAGAAKSALAQVRGALCTPGRHAAGNAVAGAQRSTWDDLFDLSTCKSGAGSDDGQTSNRTASQPARHLRPKVHNGVRSMHSAGSAPTPPPQLEPPSAALSLWQSRSSRTSSSTLLGCTATAHQNTFGPDFGSTSPVNDESSSGGFGALERTSSGVHFDRNAKHSTEFETRCACLDLDSYSAPSPSASSLLHDMSTSLSQLQDITQKVHDVVADHVWAGFTDDAASELLRLQNDGQAAARKCRHASTTAQHHLHAEGYAPNREVNSESSDEWNAASITRPKGGNTQKILSERIVDVERTIQEFCAAVPLDVRTCQPIAA